MTSEVNETGEIPYVGSMKQLMVIALGGALLAGPVAADDPQSEIEEGFNLLSEGVELMFRGLLDEMEPALKDLSGALSDLNGYHAPEILPNGDIIIRRRTPLPADDTSDGEIEI